jgi:hypothetical protein
VLIDELYWVLIYLQFNNIIVNLSLVLSMAELLKSGTEASIIGSKIMDDLYVQLKEATEILEQAIAANKLKGGETTKLL